MSLRFWLSWTCALAACLSSAAAEQQGLASFYAGVPGRSAEFTAAHRTLPFGTMVHVIRIDTGASVVVRINDRGPFLHGRIIDLSTAAAGRLGMLQAGLARVTLQVIPPPAPAIRQAAFRCMKCTLPPIME